MTVYIKKKRLQFHSYNEDEDLFSCRSPAHVMTAMRSLYKTETAKQSSTTNSKFLFWDHRQWRRQLWGTGARAPSSSN